MAQSSRHRFNLKILVAKEDNKVILAESNKQFIDVLFSYMIIPIARAIRLTSESSLGDIGCFNNLYKSVENLDENFLQNLSCRDILLNPRSAAEIYCRDLKINLIESQSYEFYACVDNECNVISCYRIGNCLCGKRLKHKLTLPNSSYFPKEEGVFLKSTSSFMFTDDFQVMPVSTMTGLTLLRELEKYGKIEERTINVGDAEVLKLLKCSLTSKTPLSDTFLKSSDNKSDNEDFGVQFGQRDINPLQKIREPWRKGTKIHLKLIFDKVNNTALYAEVKEDFVNLICTFLTFPLGYIFSQFPCLSFKGCLGNLHKTIQDSDVNLFCSEERKDILVNPKLAPGLAYNDYLIGIKEAVIPSECSTFSPLVNSKSRGYPMSYQGERNSWEGFIKGPSMFMVMDNLEVKPLSPSSVKCLIDKFQVPISDIGEQEMILDEDQALHLLAASLASEHALTNTFLLKETNIDCLDFLRFLWGGKRTSFKGL